MLVLVFGFEIRMNRVRLTNDKQKDGHRGSSRLAKKGST
jgi:hypothetical protein